MKIVLTRTASTDSIDPLIAGLSGGSTETRSVLITDHVAAYDWDDSPATLRRALRWLHHAETG